MDKLSYEIPPDAFRRQKGYFPMVFRFRHTIKSHAASCFRMLLCLLLCLSFCSCADSSEPLDPKRQSAPYAYAEPGNEKDHTLRSYETTPESIYAPESSEDTLPKSTRISFLAAGDNIIYYGNVRDAEMLAAGTNLKYNFTNAYRLIADMVADADISFINQETLMAGDEYELSYYPGFNSPQEVGLALVETGFDIVNIANNHMLDRSQNGDRLTKTINFWRSQPVFTIGDYINDDDYNTVRIYEYNGVRIAFLAYTYDTNGIRLNAGLDLVVPYLKKDDIRRQVAAAREQADLVFVSCHWGTENSFEIDSSQQIYAQLMCDLDVDIIIGHHPHVIQPVQWLENDHGGRTLCFYSLGNLMAEMAADYNMVGGIATFDIVREEGKTPHIENPVFHPTVFYFTKSFRDNTIYPMQDFTEELASSHGISYYGNSTTLQKLRRHVTNVIDSDFLPDFMKD